MDTPLSPPRLKNLVASERPQERLERLGPGALSDTELIAMILRSGSKSLDVLGLASTLVTQAGSLGAMSKWSKQDFAKIPGIGPVKALQLVTIMEIANRVVIQNKEIKDMLDQPDRVFEYLSSYTIGLEVEKFWVLCLNRKNRLMRMIEVTSGTATASLVHPREVFRAAIREGASAVIVAHNHPSGDPSPSRADIQVTRQLRESAKTLDIPLQDHVIVGSPAADPNGIGYYSFSESGLL